MSEWQPIETAPKDGTEIILGHWYEDESEGYFGPSRWIWIASGCFEPERTKDHFWSDIHDDELPCAGLHRPTHWKPLPEPPNTNIKEAISLPFSNDTGTTFPKAEGLELK